MENLKKRIMFWMISMTTIASARRALLLSVFFNKVTSPQALA